MAVSIGEQPTPLLTYLEGETTIIRQGSGDINVLFGLG